MRALAGFALLAVVAPLAAQDVPPLRLVARRDTVLVFLSETPRTGGFVLYRSTVPAAGAATAPVKLTASPILRERQPAVAAGMLGTDLPMVMRAVRAVDESEMLRRITIDPVAGNALTYLSRAVAQVLGRFYRDTAVTAGVTYEYRAVFTDLDGNETNRAVTARVRAQDIAPAPPTRLVARAGDHEINLTWAYPRYSGDPADLVFGFHLYRAQGQGPFERLTPLPLIRNEAAPFGYRDGDAVNGVSYRYQLTAVDIIGRESGPTAPATIAASDKTPPGVPTDLAARTGDGVVVLTWRLGPEVDLAGYWVERSDGITEAGRRLNRVLIPARQPVWTDTVPGAHQYFYRVIAVDQAGNASIISNALAVLPPDKTPPPPPSRVTATAGAGHRVTVRWMSPATGDIRGYNVYRGDDTSRIDRVNARPVVGTQFVDTGYAGRGLRPGGSYFVEVSTLDSSFNESRRTRATVTIPDDDPPAPPSAFDVRGVSGRYADVVWSGSGALDVAAYVLTRSSAIGAKDSTVNVGRFPQDERTWRDTTLVHGRRYVYRLVAVDSAGNRSAPAVDTIEFQDPTPPPAPRIAAAKVAPTGVVVTWERVIASELVGYHVYRSTLPTGVFQRVTSVPVTALTFTDPTGKLGLFYIVRAIDRSSNESAASPPAEVLR